MREHVVIVVGGGPTGLTLAGELALAGVDVAIVERRAAQHLPGARAGGQHARTIEILDMRGIADRFLIAPWADRVRSVGARYAGPWELQAIGAVAAPRAVLVRPHGRVAWVGDGGRAELADALATWFGPPAGA